jgi:hypothetical protein
MTMSSSTRKLATREGMAESMKNGFGAGVPFTAGP